MANEAIVLQDKEGHYYVIPKETLEDARVADESKAVVDEDLGEVSGFALGAIIFVGGISPSSERIGSEYHLNAAWPCDSPASEGNAF